MFYEETGSVVWATRMQLLWFFVIVDYGSFSVSFYQYCLRYLGQSEIKLFFHFTVLRILFFCSQIINQLHNNYYHA